MGIWAWVDTLTTLIEKESTHGVDTALVEKIQADGKTLSDVLPAGKVNKEKKGRARKTGEKKDAAAPSKRSSISAPTLCGGA